MDSDRIIVLVLIVITCVSVEVRSECRPLNLQNPVRINVTSSVQNLTSPNYPNNYNDSLDCYWLLHIDSSQTLYLYVKEHNVVCSEDYLIIYRGLSGENLLYNGCAADNAGTQTYINTTVSTGVRFQSDNNDSNRGFLLLFSTDLQTLQNHVTNTDSGSGSGNGNGSNNGTLGGTDSNSATHLVKYEAIAHLVSFIVGMLLLEYRNA